MNYKLIRRHIILTLLVLSIQVLVLSRVDLTFGDFKYIHLYLYPYLILTLPFRINKYFSLILAFVIGMIVDIFFGTYGIHAASLVLFSFLRPAVFGLFEPKEGYLAGESPSVSKNGISWLVSVASLLMIAFCLFLFSVEAFSFIYLSEILLQSIFSFLGSMILIILTFILFNSKS